MNKIRQKYLNYHHTFFTELKIINFETENINFYETNIYKLINLEWKIEDDINYLDLKIKKIEKNKISKWKNNILKLITLNFYDFNKICKNKIIEIKNKKSAFQVLKMLIKENRRKIYNRYENLKNKKIIEEINSIDLQNQPSTSGYKPNPLKI